MNPENYDINQKKNSNFDSKNDLNEQKIWEMEQEMELLQEQVKSLKKELGYGYDFIKESLQELEYTKEELEWMNQEISNLMNSKKLPMSEAEQVASRMLKKKRAIHESTAELVGATERYPANFNEFEGLDISSLRSLIAQCKANLSNLKTQSHQIILHSIKVTAQSKHMLVKSSTIQTRSREVIARLNQERIDRKSLEAPTDSRLPFRAIAN
jgi:hypothetical protein